MPVNAPIPIDRQLATLELLELRPGMRVLDIGCGTGELLIALARRGFEGLGIDVHGPSIEAATGAAGELPVRFECRDVTAGTLPAVGLVTCIGATYAYGRGPDALTGTLHAIHASQPPSTLVLIGESFHRPPIPDGYAALLGEPTGIERTHAENVWACEEAGFECLHATVATPTEWDAFEWAHYRLTQRTEWRDGYLRWGCDVMGFGLYLMRVH